MSDVPASDTRAIVAEVSQHEQRSVVSLSPVAGEPSGAGGSGNQNCAVRAAVASVHRKVDRHRPGRVFGSNTILDDRGPGGEA